MREGMAEHGVVTTLFAHVWQGCRIPLMEANGYTECFECGPQWLVVGVVPVPAINDVRAQEDAAEAQLVHTAAGLGDGVSDVEGRDHAGPQQPLTVGRTEVIQPVVIRPGNRSG